MEGDVSKIHKKLDRRKWEKVRKEVLDRDGWRCVQCSKAGRMEVDHITDMSKGGAPYDLDNLRTLCSTCHIRRSFSPMRLPWLDYQTKLTKEYEK